MIHIFLYDCVRTRHAVVNPGDRCGRKRVMHDDPHSNLMVATENCGYGLRNGAIRGIKLLAERAHGAVSCLICFRLI